MLAKLSALAGAAILALSLTAPAQNEPEVSALTQNEPKVPSDLTDSQRATPQSVNQGDPVKRRSAAKGFDPSILRMQILLDRALVSPGVLDGRSGANTSNALRVYAQANALGNAGVPTAVVWDALTTANLEPALRAYRISAEDVQGPFLSPQPTSFEDMAAVDALSYASPQELLAEKFHMHEDLLTRLNPGADFGREGGVILVANVSTADQQLNETVSRIVVDKRDKSVSAYDAAGGLLAYFPATIRSAERPAPNGSTTVTAVADAPNYTFDPESLSWGPDIDQAFIIPPGPNNPVGGTWIDLAIDGYGIHGTPEPARIGKTYSHGCVRLTNWDAQILGAAVEPGTPVEFQS